MYSSGGVHTEIHHVATRLCDVVPVVPSSQGRGEGKGKGRTVGTAPSPARRPFFPQSLASRKGRGPFLREPPRPRALRRPRP